MSAADDLYPRPSRQEIAARVAGSQPTPAANEDGNPGDAVTRHQPENPLANFSVHLCARMRALGWDQAALQGRAGISAHVAAKAINGTGCDLALAGKLAELVGGYLAAMIGPYMCSTCYGDPPAGYACLECGTEARAA